MTSSQPKLIAFHLPQFHPIPENDQWWGQGFTEWTNVTSARPVFPGHQQPKLPRDLGFYDLRLAEARVAQAELAKMYGIHGFCFWHYWFHGRRLLEQPVNQMLASGQPDFPFCLAWANESWSRSWLGDDRQILIEQRYSQDDDVNHARWLAQAFADPRYIRVHGRPMFLVYRPTRLPDAKRTVETMRNEIERLGLPNPYMVGINAHSYQLDMRELGFDMTEHHEPQLGVLPGLFNKPTFAASLQKRLASMLGRAQHIYEFDAARELMNNARPNHPHFPAYFVGWDNTPRRGKNAIVIRGSTPAKVAQGLKELLSQVCKKPTEEQIIFINAWNEWAEGMYLEPDLLHGRELLEAIHNVIRSIASINEAPDSIKAC